MEQSDPPLEGSDGSSLPLATPAPDPATPLVATDAVSFTGDGWEYFRIWIVNLALTIATLGVYSAWAKVRRLQYFHRNTHLAGATFDFEGDPIAIFKGRMIAGALFLTYSFAGAVSPRFALVVLVTILLALPWMLSRSLRFRLRNTTYRGLPFRFTGSTQSAYWVFLGLPVLAVCTLGLLGPFWYQRMKRYQFNHAQYGGARTTSNPAVGDFYTTFIAATVIGGALLAVVSGVLVAVFALAAVFIGPDGAPSDEAVAALTLVGLAVVAPIYVTGVLTIQAFVTTRIRNDIWNATTIGTRSFKSTMRTRSLLGITLTNLLATAATLGLFWPFAQVRLVKYFTSTLAMTGPTAFAEFEAVETIDESAVGEEVTDLFDFDIAF